MAHGTNYRNWKCLPLSCVRREAQSPTGRGDLGLEPHFVAMLPVTKRLWPFYFRHHLASREGIVWLSVHVSHCVCVCVCVSTALVSAAKVMRCIQCS